MTFAVGDDVLCDDGTPGQIWSDAEAPHSVWVAIDGAPARCVRTDSLRALVEQPELEA